MSDPIDALRQKCSNQSIPLETSVTLSLDGKNLSFSSGESFDASLKYCVVGEKKYSLASLYLACANRESFVSQKKACGRHGVEDPVKVSDRNDILKFFGLFGESVSLPDAGAQQQEEGEEGEERGSLLEVDNDMESDVVLESGSKRKERDEEEGELSGEEVSKKPANEKEKQDKKGKSHEKSIDEKSKSMTMEDISLEKSKREKRPITNEQVMENLMSVASKRGENRVIRKEEEEMRQSLKYMIDEDDPNKLLSTTTISSSSLEQLPTPSAQVSTLPPTPSNESDAKTDLILNALSAKGYEINEDAITSDRESTEKITLNEQPVGDSASILCFAGRDFSRILELYTQVKKDEERMAYYSARPGSSGSKQRPRGSSKSSSRVAPRKKPKGLPLIIVPNAMTSPITMINAEEFFGHAKFIPREVQLKNRVKKAATVKIKRRVSSRCAAMSNASSEVLEYEIMDNPKTKLKPDQWDRVVAVVAQGADWQFKGWKYSSPVDLFSRCFGFYIGMENDTVPKVIQGWNVKLAKLNRDKRNLDSVSYAMFWNNLDEWMTVHKPEYLQVIKST